MIVRLLIVLVLFPCMLYSQTYNVGTPVYDTLTVGTFYVAYSPQACYNRAITWDIGLQQDPAGTQVYMKIIGGSFPSGALHEQTFGIMNVGDSMIASGSPSADFAFYSSNGTATMTYAFIRIGVPTTQQDSFFCKEDIGGSAATLIDGCTMVYVEHYYAFGSQNCYVDGPLEMKEEISVQLNVSPNPSSGVFHFTGVSAGQYIQVRDLLGRIILEYEILDATEASIDLSSYPPGIYSYTFHSDFGPENSGKLVVK